MLLLRFWKNSIRVPRLDSTGSAMIFVLVIAVIGNILIGSIMLSNRYTTRKSGIRRGKVSVLNICEAGKEHFYAKLLYEGYVPPLDSIDVVFDRKPFANGSYTVKCSTGTTADTMKLRVRGEEGENSTTIEVLVTKKKEVDLATMDIRSKSAVVAKSDVEITGNITIDGREYDTLGNIIGGGSFGIITETVVNLNGSAAVGGNTLAPVGKKDFNTYRPALCKEGFTIADDLSSPEAFMGLSEGSIDKFKGTIGDVNFPFNGLVYIEEDVKNVDLTDCSGIFIVHNSSKTAELHINKGNFKGLIICDVMNKSNGNIDVLGSVVTLGESGNSKFGNGNANLRYSKQALNNLEAYCTNIQDFVKELSWRELPD